MTTAATRNGVLLSPPLADPAATTANEHGNTTAPYRAHALPANSRNITAMYAMSSVKGINAQSGPPHAPESHAPSGPTKKATVSPSVT